MDTRSARRLVVLAAVFFAVAVWNGVLTLEDQVVWRGTTAAVCAVASAGLLSVVLAAVRHRHRS